MVDIVSDRNFYHLFGYSSVLGYRATIHTYHLHQYLSMSIYGLATKSLVLVFLVCFPAQKMLGWLQVSDPSACITAQLSANQPLTVVKASEQVPEPVYTISLNRNRSKPCDTRN